VRTQGAANQAADGAPTGEHGHEQGGGEIAEAQQLQPEREKDHRVPWRAAHYPLPGTAQTDQVKVSTSPSTPASLSHADFTAALHGRQGKKRQKFSAQQPDAILCSWHCSDCMQGKWRIMSFMLKFTRLVR
jgi:hypothetical protein